ncbi:MAG: response regulator [Gemmatimonadota bacterium]
MTVPDQTPARQPEGRYPYQVVVVDKPPDLESTCQLARDLGYYATGVNRGLEALKLVRTGEVHLVITELFMSGIDGWDLAAYVERERPAVPVVALVSSVTEQGEAVLTSRKIDGYLVKPVERRQLEILLRALLLPTSLGRTAAAVLVDTNADCLSRLEKALGDVGVATVAFDDPRQAAAYTAEHLPDLIVTELDLGDQSGFDLCAEVRRDHHTAHTPIFVLTDEASPPNMRRAMELHVDGFLVKPMTPEVLTRRILRRLRAAPG